jgi:cytochrome c553
MKNWFPVTTLVILIGAVNVSMAAGGDPAAGKEKSGTCAGCHGSDGNSMNPEWPKLAGQNPEYIVKQLEYFQDGERESPVMAPMAMGLSEQDRQDLAAYFASQTVKIGTAQPDLVMLGAMIYRSGNQSSGVAACMGCHGPAGGGNPAAGYPALRGQHSVYVANQMDAFRAGTRKNEQAMKIMQGIAARMTEDEIQAVSSYIEGLH